MPFNGSGTFTRTNGTNVGTTTWQLDRDAGANILSGRHDTHDQDIATGLSNCITKDGQTTITANLPMSGYRHTNVANASSRSDYASAAQVQDGSIVYAGTSAGSGNTYTAILAPSISAYSTGMKVVFKADKSNTGTATLNLSSLGAVTFYKNGSLALEAGDIVIDTIYEAFYDSASGGKFHLVNPSTSADRQADGWTVVRDTWTYASATTFTVAGDKTALFNSGDKIKLTQTTVKYFYVVSASYGAPNTTVTVTGGTTFTLANAAITSPYYSKDSSPNGFSHWFAYTPTYVGFSSNPTIAGLFKLEGRKATIALTSTANGTSNSTNFRIGLPFTCSNSGVNYYGGGGVGVDNSNNIFNIIWQINATSAEVTLAKTDGSGWTAANNKTASLTCFYSI